MKRFFTYLGITVLLVVLLTIAYLYSNRAKLANIILEKSLPRVEELLTKELPASVSKEQVHQDFDQFIAKLRSGQVDTLEMKKLLTTFTRAMRDDKMDSLEAKALLEILHDLSQ